MKLDVIGVMRSHLDQNAEVISNDNMSELLEDLKRFSGAEAGICYMSKPYFDSYVTDKDKALARFSTVAKTGHHSIAGHAQVALLLDGVPKILAMFLNNLTDYETSEKSGRYTVMTGNTSLETEAYEKWCGIMKDLIQDEYDTKIDDRTCDKLAKENARYFLSVFTPTTMGYTTSLRQWNYIYDWAIRYTNRTDLPDNFFFNSLKTVFKEFAELLKPLIYVEELREFKNRDGFDMINSDISSDIDFQFGKMYHIGYTGSFAEFAQAQRHRTLFYNMQFDGISQSFYVPELVKKAGLTTEWLDDMHSVAEYIPTGTFVFIEESGDIEKFFLKSLERNCGRAQLEIMQQTLETERLFFSNIYEFPRSIRQKIKAFYNADLDPKMKGQCIGCKEPCVWGCEGARTRLI